MMVLHIASQTSMKLTGPEASAPTPRTGAPLGLSVEKSCPMPPPCWSVSAASRTLAKIEPMSSPISPMTKQLKSVTPRAVPAPARMRPAGMNAKPVMASKKRRSQALRLARGSAEAAAAATLARVSSTDRSAWPPGGSKRYLASQICRETGTNMVGRSIALYS